MKTRTLLCAVAAIALNTGVAAYAQGNPTLDSIEQQRYGRDLGPDRGNSRQWQRDAVPAGDARRDNRSDYRRDDRRGYDRGDRGYARDGYARDGYARDGYARDGYAHGGYRNYGGRGAGPDHSFYRGERLPREYRSHYYVVDDWRGHRLSPPPRGYHWVQAGSDYVLVAIATGIIAQILLSQ